MNKEAFDFDLQQIHKTVCFYKIRDFFGFELSKISGIIASNCLTLIILSILNTAVKIFLIKGLLTPFSIKIFYIFPNFLVDIIKYIND